MPSLPQEGPLTQLMHRIFKPSTLAFTREARRLHFSWFEWLHGYVYGRWSHLYIGIGTRRHPLVRWINRFLPEPRKSDLPISPAPIPSPTAPRPLTMADTYHGKVVPLESARQLVQVNEDVRLENLEKIIPYPRARDIVLQNPDHIVVLDCPCRSARDNPCLPLDVCMIVGEPFASFVIDHQPRRARWITPETALEILEAEDRRGHVHHAFFKDVMLDRFYAICNCCACCCGAIHAHQHGSPMLASSGYIGCVDTELCVNCGYCAEFCQFAAISYASGYTEIDTSACMGCGVCLSKCDQGALSLTRSPSRGEPLEIRNLMDQAAKHDPVKPPIPHPEEFKYG